MIKYRYVKDENNQPSLK